jgi:uncharacterized protein (TIGR02444 family)
LWDWALRAYGATEVERLCLELQDVHGQCICFLLWAAWAAEGGRPSRPADLARAVATARTWNERALEPLRAARRGLKPTSPGIDDGGREDLRTRVRGAELAAERLLLEALEAGSPPARRRPPRDLATALAGAAQAWNGAAPAALEALAEAFPRDRSFGRKG